MSLVDTSLFGELTILPIPSQTPIGERLGWKTNILLSENGVEQPLQVRNLPRRRYDYTLPTGSTEYQRAFNTVYGSRVARWAVPMWTEAQNIGAVSAGLSNLAVDVTYYDFRDDSLALLWQSPRNWQIVEIETVNTDPDSLDLYGTTNAFDNAWVMPVRIGYLPSNASRVTNSYNAEMKLEFDIQDLVELPAPAQPQFLGDDIYFDEWLFTGSSFRDRVVQRVDYVDEELGVVAYRSPWVNGRVDRPMAKVLQTPKEVYEFKQFLYRRAGRYRRFRQPSFDADLRVTSFGMVMDQLRVSADDWEDHASNRVHIAIEDTSENWYPRTIIDAIPALGDQLILTLDSAINIPAESIVRVSYLGLKRLETDVIDFAWIGGGVSRSRIRILELSP